MKDDKQNKKEPAKKSAKKKITGMTPLQINSFKEYFTGNSHNYGKHMYHFNDKGTKESGTNATIKDKLLTIEQYKEHLDGKVGLGLIPIIEGNKCKVAILDIDIYDKKFDPYLMAIEKNNIPLVPFYSKSGGLHIYLFFKQPVPVSDAVDRISKLSRILGISLFVKKTKNETVEIFPKQKVLSNGQIGSWINLPYFNANKTRQALIRDGKPVDINNALTIIKSSLTTIKEIDELIENLPYSDAPPCLQTMYLLNNFSKNSGRNNYLFSFGVYLKKKDENYFEQEVIKINEGLRFPLKIKEIEETILSSLRKKDYTYKCTVSPCLDFCDKKVCKNREFGIGKNNGYFTNLILGDLVQYNSSEPYYEWSVKVKESDEFSTLRFKNEDEIIKQDAFLRLCFRKLHFLPFKMKQIEWFKLVRQALMEIEVVEVEKEYDTSPLIVFNNLLYDFLTSRAFATTKDQVTNKRVYFHKSSTPSKEYYLFRVKDLMEYLYVYKNFRLFSLGQVHGILRDMGARKGRVRTESGNNLRLIKLYRTGIETESVDSADSFEPDFKAYDDEDTEDMF